MDAPVPGRAHPPRDTGVESNARLTGTTGLLLIVMLAAEGVTILSIRPLLSWHIALGLALIPPVGLKMASTTWRFGRYYLSDPRYRRAGPPSPVLRALGPVVVATTVALLASGVLLWLAGPDHRGLLTIHQASFVLWIAAMTIHVLAHILRALRLAGADLVVRSRVAHTATRQALVLSSLAAGIGVAVATRGLSSGWQLWLHNGH